jgi:hypothetical protein
VHFARWVVIDQLKMDWPGAPRPAPRLRSEYLLFTADVTVPPAPEDPMPEGFLRELLLRVPDVVDDVWGHCEGWPRVGTREERVRYLADSRVDTALYYVGHPNATVDEIRHALAVRDALVAFVREHQDTEDPAALHQDYVERSRAWLGST